MCIIWIICIGVMSNEWVGIVCCCVNVGCVCVDYGGVVVVVGVVLF